MTEPLRISIDVACSAEHAFTVWTSGIGSWWPPDHTVSGRGDLEVFLLQHRLDPLLARMKASPMHIEQISPGTPAYAYLT